VTIGEAHTRVEPDLADVLYRTVRELLTNVRQGHARANTRSPCRAPAARGNGSILITVADDGVGFSGATGASRIPLPPDSGVGPLEHRSAPSASSTPYLDIHSTRPGLAA